MKLLKHLLWGVLLVVVGCSSTTRDYKGAYEESLDIDGLEVPPGLNRPAKGSSGLPELEQTIKTYSSYEESLRAQPNTTYLREYQGVAFKRDGSLYWLEVDAPADEVWDDIRAFFVRLGFDMVNERPQIGYLETDWLENKVDIPNNFIGRLLESVYSAEILDKYRVRVEPQAGADGKGARLFISHQGLREIIEGEDDNLSAITTRWVPRPSDPELEVEMLMRYMTFRGIKESVAKQQIAATTPQERADLQINDDSALLVVNEPFNRAWRHINIALDRLGFIVEDRNRSAGVFYIQLPESFVLASQTGFGKFFASTVRPQNDKYLLVLEQQGNTTTIVVKPNGEVAEDLPRVSQKILTDLRNNIL